MFSVSCVDLLKSQLEAIRVYDKDVSKNAPTKNVAYQSDDQARHRHTDNA